MPQTVKMYTEQMWIILQYHGFHKKFNQNRSIRPRSVGRRWNCKPFH